MAKKLNIVQSSEKFYGLFQNITCQIENLWIAWGVNGIDEVFELCYCHLLGVFFSG